MRTVTHRQSLTRLHSVNLKQLAAANAKSSTSSTTTSGSSYKVAPLGRAPHPAGTQAGTLAGKLAPKTVTGFAGNASGESGFDGISAAINGGANSPEPPIGGVGDVTPPDQGLAVGPSSEGTVQVEFVNDSLVIYSSTGQTLLGALAGFQVFGLPPNTFLSDPRAYWDPGTGHWFLTMFDVGDGGTPSNGECSNGAAPPNCLSTQFIAISTSTDPFGTYTVFGIDTSDSSNSANGCPCFGDFDQVGADANGIYISTNEFPLNSGGPGFNGSVIYAMSKSGAISAANGAGPLTVVSYTVPFLEDPFAGYHVTPSTVTQGSSDPDTEYFVESNANVPNNAITSGLEVFALEDTSQLGTGGTPTLALAPTVATEDYTELPPNATQESGPTPLGTSVGFDGTATIDSDFSAVQEVTYADGNLYAELSTGFAYGGGTNVGAAWFALQPASDFSTVTNAAQGYVETAQNLLYPVIGVDANGNGYMAFAAVGPQMYASAAYVDFNGIQGPIGDVHIAAAGVAPLDTFDCYPAFGFSTGQCRWGDYSMAQVYNGNIYMATEYVGAVPRDKIANWDTFLYSAPVPAPGGYAVDAYGHVANFGDSPAVSAPSVSASQIFRGIVTLPNRTSGYVLDGHGNVDPFGGAAAVTGNATWPTWDIARGIALDPCDTSGASGYVLDGWGGIHAYGTAPAATGGAYWPGWDIARAIVVNPTCGGGGYVLDGWGGIHPFATGGSVPAVPTGGAYWPGWNIARAIVLTGTGQGYELDGWGGLHEFGGAAATSGAAYWHGWDIARGVIVLPGEAGGYVLDGWGGVHPFQIGDGPLPPSVSLSTYAAGQDIFRGIS